MKTGGHSSSHQGKSNVSQSVKHGARKEESRCVGRPSSGSIIPISKSTSKGDPCNNSCNSIALSGSTASNSPSVKPGSSDVCVSTTSTTNSSSAHGGCDENRSGESPIVKHGTGDNNAVTAPCAIKPRTAARKLVPPKDPSADNIVLRDGMLCGESVPEKELSLVEDVPHMDSPGDENCSADESIPTTGSASDGSTLTRKTSTAQLAGKTSRPSVQHAEGGGVEVIADRSSPGSDASHDSSESLQLAATEKANSISVPPGCRGGGQFVRDAGAEPGAGIRLSDVGGADSVEHGGRGHGAEGAVLPGLHCPAEQKMAVPLPPQLMTSFIKVMSRRDESHEFDWPEEMVQYTVVQPAISFSCNPLLFDFSRLLPSSSRHITTPGIANAEDGPIVDEQGFPIPEQGCSGVDPGRGGKAGRRSRQGKKKKAGHKRRRRGNHPSHGHLPDSSRHAGIDVAEESDSSQRSKGHQGEKVRRTGEKVRRTGEKVRHTGEKVRHAGEKVRHAGEEKVEKSPDRGDRQCSSCEDQRIEQKRHQSASRSERKVAHGAKCGVALCGNADDSAANKTIPVVAFVEATMRRPQHRRNKKHRRHRIGLSHKPETSCLAVDRKPVGPTDGRKPNEPKVRIDYTENEEDCNIFSTGVCDPTDFSTTKKTEKIDVPHIPEPGGLEAGKMPAVLDIGRGRVEKDTVVCGENGMLSVRAKAEKRSCALGTDFSRQVNSEASCNPAGVDDAQESVSNPKPVPAASFERKRQVCQPSSECEPSSKVCRVDVSEIVPSESNAVLGWTLADGAYERHSQVGKSKWESDSENDVDFLKRVVDPEHENVSSAQQGTKVNRMNRQPEHRGRRKDNEAVQRQKTTHKLRRSESSEGSSCYVSGDSYSQTNSYSRSRSYSQSSRSSYDYSSHCRSSSRYSSRSCSFRSSSRGTSRSRSGGRNCSFSSYSESSFITSNSRYFRRSRSRSSSRSRSHYRFRSVRRKLHRRRVIRGLYDSSSNLKCVVSNVDEVKGRDATEIPLPVADEVPTSKEQEKVTNIPLPAADSAISLPSSSTTEGVVTCSVCGSDPTPDQSTTTASCTTQGGLSVSTATAIVGNPDSVPGVGPCGDSSHNRQSTVHSVGMVNDDRSAISVSATNESENVVYSTAVVGRDSSSSEAGPRFLPRSLLLHGPRLLDQYGFGQLPHNSEEWPCLPKSFAQQAPEFVQPRQRFECQPRVCELPQRLAGQLRHFGNIPQRFDGPPKRFDGPPQRFNGGSQHFNVPPQRFDGRSQRFNGPPQRLDGPPQRSDGPHHRFDGPHRHFDGPPQCIHRPPQRLDGPDQHLNWPPQRLDGPPQRLDRPPQRLDGALQRLDGPPRRFDGPLNVLDGMLQPRVLRSTPPVEAHHRLSNSACPPHLRTVQCLRDMPSLRNTFATPQGPPPRGMLPVDVKQELGVATRCPDLRQRPPLNTSLSDVGHSLRPQSMPTQPAPPPIGAHRFNLPALGGLPGPREQHAQYSPTHPERHIPPLLTRDMSMTLGGQTQPASVIATLPQSFASRPQSDTLQPPRLCGQPSSPSCPTAVPQNMSVPPPPGFNAHLLGLNPPPILPSLPLDARSVTKVSPPFPPHTCQSLRQLPPQPSTAAAINIPPTKSSPPPLPPPKPPSPQPPPPPKKEELKPMQPVIPPERIDQYRRLQELAQKHARKQLRRQQQRERGEPESESSEGEQEAVDGAILPEDDDATESELAEMERAALEAGRSFLARGHAAAIVVPAVAESPLLQQPHHTVLISPQPSISSIPLAAGTQFLQAGQHILVPSSYMSQAGIIAAQNSAYPLQGAPIVALPQAVPAATGHTQLAAPTGAITLVPHPHIPGLQIAVAAGHPAAGVGGDLAAHYVPAALAAQHQAQLAAQYQIQLAAQHQAQLAAQVAQVQVASPHHVVAVNAAGQHVLVPAHMHLGGGGAAVAQSVIQIPTVQHMASGHAALQHPGGQIILVPQLKRAL